MLAENILSPNSRLNSLGSISIKNRVVHLIDDSNTPLSPCEIATKLNENPSSVRGACRELAKEGAVMQPYGGYYCSKSTHGLLVPLLVHNLRLRCVVNEAVEHWERVEVTGDVKVKVCFGAWRRRITGFIACDRGMSKDACLYSLNRWFDIAEGRLGHPLAEVELRSVEFNRDYVGLRLDGSLRCLTRRGLHGVIERIYQKKDCVRHELKISKPMSLTMFEALLEDGSVAGYGLHEFVHELSKNVVASTKVLKHLNAKVGAVYEYLMRDPSVERRKLLQEMS